MLLIGLIFLLALSIFSIKAEAAWWNSDYGYCKNITLTESKGINRTFEPMKVNLTGLAKQADNDDVRIVDTFCNNGGNEIPRDVISSNSDWAYVIFLANYTTTDAGHIYSAYYDYAGASAPSYSGTLTLTGNTTEYNVTVTNQYKMMYENAFRDGAVKFIYYNNGTTLQQWGQFDDFNSASTQTLTTILNGTVMNSFYSNSSYKDEIYECYDKNFYCKIQYLHNPAANYYTVCPETNPAPIYWSDGAWAVGTLGNKNTIAIAWNNSNAKLVAQMNITGWTTQGCIRSDGSNWYTSTADGCTFGGNSSRAFYLLFNLPYDANSTFDKLLNPMAASLGSEQGAPAAPTSIQLWLNGNENNITMTYGSALNSTAQINVTGLWTAIEKNGTLIANGTATSTNVTVWSAGYYNMTAYYSGNAAYLASDITWWAGITKAAQSLNLSFNTSDSIVQGTPVLISCSGNESEAFLYNDSSIISSPFEQDTAGLIGLFNYTCNTTGDENYTSGAANKTLNITSAPPSSNASISYIICHDNSTLLANQSIYHDGILNITGEYINCANGCDNVTMACNPPEYMQNVYNMAIVAVIIIFFAVLIVWAKRRR